MAREFLRIRYTLVMDGPGDRCLRPIIDGVIKDAIQPVDLQLEPQIPDFRELSQPPKDLIGRVRQAVRLYPCDILFVHRDAEAQSREKRLEEIDEAVKTAGIDEVRVPVIPIRMTEAWLLISEGAIRQAADNPNGKTELNLPGLNRLESVSNPKKALHDLLTQASEKTGRRRERFKRDLAKRAYRIALYVEDFSPLRSLPAFQAFEEDTQRAVKRLIGGLDRRSSN